MTSAAEVIAGQLRPGDSVWVAEACGEPRTLVDALAEVAPRHPDISIYLGWTLRRPPILDAAKRIRSTMGLGRWGGSAGDYLPVRYSQIPKLMRTGALEVDLLLLQVSPPDRDGICSTSVQAGWLPIALECARTVVAEVNENLPLVPGFPCYPLSRFDATVTSRAPVLEFGPKSSGVPADLAVRAADAVPDGAVLQFGPGEAISATLAELASRGTRLAVRSGLVTDDLIVLDQSGCLSPTDPIVTGMLCGSHRLIEWAAQQPRVRGLSLDETHDLARLTTTRSFVALNSALEVDLTGAADTESIEAGVVGGLGGHGDFSLGASLATGGTSIVALPSTRAGRSSIVPRVQTTTPRTDIDIVVTEHGAVHLGGRSLTERASLLRSIAAPAHRDDLAVASHALR